MSNVFLGLNFISFVQYKGNYKATVIIEYKPYTNGIQKLYPRHVQ